MDRRGPTETPARPKAVFGLIDGTAPRPEHKGYVAGDVQWRRGLATAADGTYATASDGRIALWNLAAERIMGYGAAEVLGRPCCDVFASRDSDGEPFCSRTCRLRVLIKSGEPVESFDLQTHTRGGRPIWLNVSTVVMPVTSSRDYRVIRMFRDVTAVKDMLALIRDRLTGTPTEQDPVGRLTRREAEILRLMASGATNRMLAIRLNVSTATVRNHTHNIFEKLGVHTRVAAVMSAISQFMI
jgi:PAS domain S-box-containing protein